MLNNTKTGIRLPRSSRPDQWINIEDAVVPLESYFHGHPLVELVWDHLLEELFSMKAGKCSRSGVFVHQLGFFLLTISNMVGRKDSGPSGVKYEGALIWRNLHRKWTKCILVAHNLKRLLTNRWSLRKHRFLANHDISCVRQHKTSTAPATLNMSSWT